MSSLKSLSRIPALAALVVCTLAGGGCAGLRVPRIDPTGERVFVRPQNRVPAASLAAGSSFGNVQAPPVFTDPVFPQPPMQTQPALAAGPVVGAPLPMGTFPAGPISTAQPLLGGVPPIPQDKLTITPERVLAPVGSEVLLRAGICTREGFLLANQRIDWMLAARDAGQFVQLGGRGWLQSPLLPWNKSKKVDNHFATGYTASVPLCITRGTADPSDDVQIRRGDAWVSVTSAIEGTSHLTAFTPAIESWQGRRASATIYWVDVEWTFPPPAVTGSSGPQVLTTTVTRQTDKQPLQGWIVRYEVADGGGAFRRNGSQQTVEVTTGADGRASVEVTPTNSAGSSQITMQLVRPPRLHGSDAPRLVVGNGSTTIHWNGSSPYLSSPEDTRPGNTGTAIPTYPIPGNGATRPIEPAPTTSPLLPPPPTRRPKLDVEISGAPTAVVDGEARFAVLIRNTGDATATSIVLNDRFDPGLSHLRDIRGEHQIEYTGVRDLAPGDSETVNLLFGVMRAGRLCHDVTLTYREGSESPKRACIEAIQPPPQLQPRLEVRKDGPRQKSVGEKALFTVVVENTGEVPLTNVEVVDEYDRALRPRPTQLGYEIVNGRIVWRIPRIDIGQTKHFDIECICVEPSDRACSLVKVTADSDTPTGSLMAVDDHCVEILPSPGGAASGQPAIPPVDNGTSLRMSIMAYDNPVRAGTKATYLIVVRNATAVVDEQVALSVLFPPELAPDVSAVQADVRVQLVGNELRFEPVATLRADEKLSFTIPAYANQPGVVQIVANLASRNMPQVLQVAEKVEILGR